MIDGKSLVIIRSKNSTENLQINISNLFDKCKSKYPESYNEKHGYERIDLSGKDQQIREWCTFTDIIEIKRILCKEWIYIAAMNKGISVDINTLFPVYDKYYLPMTRYEYSIKIPFVGKSPMTFDDTSALRIYDEYINDSGLRKDLVEFVPPIVQKYVNKKLSYGYQLKTKSNMFLANGFQLLGEVIE